jgi:hypothetical protein
MMQLPSLKFYHPKNMMQVTGNQTSKCRKSMRQINSTTMGIEFQDENQQVNLGISD